MSLEPFGVLTRKQLGRVFFSAMADCGLINNGNLNYWAQTFGQHIQTTNGSLSLRRDNGT